MNAPELPGAESARVPFVSVEARRATLSLLHAVGAFESGPSGNWNFVNRQLCEMLGVPASSLLGREWLNMIHPDDLQRAVAEYRQARDGGRSWHHELRFRAYDGSLLPVRIDANPLPQAQEAIGISYLGVVTDITSQARAQEVVRETQEELTTMLDAIDEGIVVHRNGWIIAANEFAARLLGYSESSELIGVHANEILVPGDYSTVAAASTAGVTTEIVATIVRRSGEAMQVIVRGKSVVHGGAPARAVVLLPTDSPVVLQLTNQRLEAQIQALAEQLTLPYSIIELRDGVAVFATVNQAYADFVGRPRSEVIGMAVADIAPRDLNPEVWDRYEEKLANAARARTFVLIYRRGDGSLVRARVHSVDHRDPVTGHTFSMSFLVPL